MSNLLHRLLEMVSQAQKPLQTTQFLQIVYIYKYTMGILLVFPHIHVKIKLTLLDWCKCGSNYNHFLHDSTLLMWLEYILSLLKWNG